MISEPSENLRPLLIPSFALFEASTLGIPIRRATFNLIPILRIETGLAAATVLTAELIARFAAKRETFAILTVNQSFILTGLRFVTKELMRAVAIRSIAATRIRSFGNLIKRSFLPVRVSANVTTANAGA